MIFLVNVPVGVFALVAGVKLLPDSGRAATAARLDLAGAALAGVGMCPARLPAGPGSPARLAALARRDARVVVRRACAVSRVTRCSASAPARRRSSSRASSAIVVTRPGSGFSLVFIASLGGIVLIFNVFLQAGLGFSPWHAAISTAPWAAGAFVGSAIGGITMHRLGRRVLHAGLVVEMLGLLGIYATFRSAGTGVGSLDLLAPMIVGGVGMGMVFVPLFDIAIADVEP